MEIRLATKHDIDAICRIYEAAKQFMSANGNASQWDGDCPGLREAKRDVRRGAQMVAVDEAGEIVGCFAFDSTEAHATTGSRSSLMLTARRIPTISR